MLSELAIQMRCRMELLKQEQELSQILAQQANQAMRLHRQSTDRLTLLFGTIIKLQEGSKAIVALGKLELADEMNVLLRTQVEMIVNVCYLQHADKKELLRFIHHDAINGYIAMQDLNRAHNGRVAMPKDLALRTTWSAAEASAASGLKLTARVWSAENPKIIDKARYIDAAMGWGDFVEMIATIYVLGSGYTHAGYKTIHKHGYWLLTGEQEAMLPKMFGVNNVLHGIGYATLIFCRYMARKFGLSGGRLDEIGPESVLIMDAMNADLLLYKKGRSATK